MEDNKSSGFESRSAVRVQSEFRAAIVFLESAEHRALETKTLGVKFWVEHARRPFDGDFERPF